MAQPIPGQPIPAMTNNPFLAHPVVVIGPQFLATYPVDLIIKSKSWSLTEGNFGVTDVNGAVIFSIKGKFLSLRDRRILLDASGHPIVSLQQKILSAHRRWQIFRGDSADHKDLLFSARKSSFLQLKTELSVFLANNTKEEVPDFKVKGSYYESSCTIYLGDSSTIVAQMHRKETASSILLDRDCFGVTVYPNMDYAFIVALVVILQEINADRNGED